MNAINYSLARKELAKTMEKVCNDSDPVVITKSNNCKVVMISLDDYHSLVESDYLLKGQANAQHLTESLEDLAENKTQTFTLSEFMEL